jgi:hypothetical protein
MEMPDATILSSRLRIVESKAGLNEIAAEPILSQNRTMKPVAIRRGFMLEEKLAILQCFDAKLPLWSQKIDCKLQSNSS